MKSVPLEKVHQALGARMVDFAGYLMPVQYSSIIEEHYAVRKTVGMFDVSHMGEFFIEGEGALDLIQKISSNDVSKLLDGQAQYGYMPNETGGIIDDMLVYRFHEKKYMLVVNASNIQKDWEWISRFNTDGTAMTDVSEEIVLLAVQGPKASETLQKITKTDLQGIKYYTFREGKIGGVDDVIISATGYTGSSGFELYVPKNGGEKVWNAVMNAGKEIGIKPAGLGARDTLRLEMGFCLYGNDIDDTTSPLEAGLGWVTKFTKPFINSEALKKQKEAGIENKLIGFIMQERGIPRAGYLLLNEEGETIGKVTSGGQSPMLERGIGLGYVKKEFSKPKTSLFVKIRNKLIKIEVKKLPLIDI